MKDAPIAHKPKKLRNGVSDLVGRRYNSVGPKVTHVAPD